MKYVAKVIWREYSSMKEVDPQLERILHISDNLFVQNCYRAVNLITPLFEKWKSDYNESKHGPYKGYVMNLMNAVITNDRWLQIWKPKIQSLNIAEGEPEIIGFTDASNKRYVCFVKIEKE